jgi:hypothetical protein
MCHGGLTQASRGRKTQPYYPAQNLVEYQAKGRLSAYEPFETTNKRISLCQRLLSRPKRSNHKKSVQKTIFYAKTARKQRNEAKNQQR